MAIKISLGDKVKCKITGFTGVAIAFHDYLHGCRRISVQPPVDKEGKVLDSASFDAPQLEIVKPKVAKRSGNATGGPEKYMPSKQPE